MSEQDAVERLDLARGVGHTTAMLKGAKNTAGVVIVAHNRSWAEELARQCPDATPIGLAELYRLRGSMAPVVVDHHAFVVTVNKLASYQNALASSRKKNEELGKRLERTRGQLKASQQENERLLRDVMDDAPPPVVDPQRNWQRRYNDWYEHWQEKLAALEEQEAQGDR